VELPPVSVRPVTVVRGVAPQQGDVPVSVSGCCILLIVVDTFIFLPQPQFPQNVGVGPYVPGADCLPGHGVARAVPLHGVSQGAGWSPVF